VKLAAAALIPLMVSGSTALDGVPLLVGQPAASASLAITVQANSGIPLGPADIAFLETTLNQLRTSQPTLLAPLPAGVTDVRFYRIFVDDAQVGIHLKAGN
jgi:hypothetical protein